MNATKEKTLHSYYDSLECAEMLNQYYPLAREMEQRYRDHDRKVKEAEAKKAQI